MKYPEELHIDNGVQSRFAETNEDRGEPRTSRTLLLSCRGYSEVPPDLVKEWCNNKRNYTKEYGRRFVKISGEM